MEEDSFVKKGNDYSLPLLNCQWPGRRILLSLQNLAGIGIRLVTDQIRFKSEAGHSIFVCIYVIYEHPQLYFKLNMQFRSAVFGFRCGSANTIISLN